MAKWLNSMVRLEMTSRSWADRVFVRDSYQFCESSARSVRIQDDRFEARISVKQLKLVVRSDLQTELVVTHDELGARLRFASCNSGQVLPGMSSYVPR